jgi:hypothetical protein
MLQWGRNCELNAGDYAFGETKSHNLGLRLPDRATVDSRSPAPFLVLVRWRRSI